MLAPLFGIHVNHDAPPHHNKKYVSPAATAPCFVRTHVVLLNFS
jgi:hypothetical protein